MKKSKRGALIDDQKAAPFGSGLEKSLCAYAGAALAAGVTLLAVTSSAQAKVVYTPAHTNIPINNYGSILLDLNHDGIADFSFWNQTVKGDQGEFGFDLSVGCAPMAASRKSNICRYQMNQIWGRGVVSGRFASALRPGFLVRPSKSYFQQARKVGSSSPRVLMGNIGGAAFSGFPTSRTSGQWMYTQRRYLGFKFIISGQVHYGWARLAVALNPAREGIAAILTGYAYETIPNKPIITGKTKGPDVITLEPATLGHLAQGASGISAWREKK
jgi:hypothetical protein